MKFCNIALMKSIINRTRYNLEGVTKHRIKVHAYESTFARQKRQESLMLRLNAEIDRYMKANGMTIFVTFTFSNEHLPYFEYEKEITDDSGLKYMVSKRIPCFSKDHCNQYFNSLRKYICDNYCNIRNNGRKDVEGDDLPLRFCWCSEYGLDPSKTQRPHYHVLMHLPSSLCKALNYDINEIKSLIAGRWKHGITGWSKKYSPIVNSDFAAIYVSKYCTKDLDFFNREDLKEYLYDEYGDKIPEHWDAFKPYAPYTKYSQHLGENLKYVYNTYEAQKNGVNFNLKVDLTKGRTKFYKCPTYIQRKTIYYYDYKEQRYKHTDFGRRCKVQAWIDSFQDSVDKLKLKCLPSEISRKLDSVDIQKSLHKYGLNDSFEVAKFVDDIINHSIDSSGKELNRTWNDFYIYKSCFQDRTLSGSLEENNFFFSKLSFSQLFSQGIFCLDAAYNNDYFAEYDETGWFSVWEKPPVYNYLDRFIGFDKIDDVLTLLDECYTEKLHLKYDEDYKRRKKYAIMAS